MHFWVLADWAAQVLQPLLLMTDVFITLHYKNSELQVILT
jgi:hypothetical protein